MTNLIKAILEIASENPFGFTIKVPSLDFVSSGIISAYEATQNNFNATNLEQVLNHSLNNDSVLGGWLDAQTNLYYFDSCKIFKNLDDALEFAKKNHQIAVFDLDSLKEIRL